MASENFGVREAAFFYVVAKGEQMPDHLDLGDHRGESVEVVAAHVGERFQNVIVGGHAFNGGIAHGGFEGFDEKRAKAAGGINYFVAFLQSHLPDNIAGNVGRRIMFAQTFALARVEELAVDVAQHVLLNGGEIEMRKIKQRTLDGDGKRLVLIRQHPVEFAVVENRRVNFCALAVGIAHQTGVAGGKVQAHLLERLDAAVTKIFFLAEKTVVFKKPQHHAAGQQQAGGFGGEQIQGGGEAYGFVLLGDALQKLRQGKITEFGDGGAAPRHGADGIHVLQVLFERLAIFDFFAHQPERFQMNVADAVSGAKIIEQFFDRQRVRHHSIQRPATGRLQKLGGSAHGKIKFIACPLQRFLLPVRK